MGIFAAGAAKFFGAVGIPTHLGAEFAMLAISTFLLTTLDTCTRLTRFLIEELFAWRNEASRYLGTRKLLVFPQFLFFSNFRERTEPSNPHGKQFGLSSGRPINYCCSCSPYLCGLSKSSRVKYGFCPVACCCNDCDAHDCTRTNGLFGFSTLLGGTAAGMFLVLGLFFMVTSWRSLTQSQNEPLTESTL